MVCKRITYLGRRQMRQVNGDFLTASGAFLSVRGAFLSASGALKSASQGNNKLTVFEFEIIKNYLIL